MVICLERSADLHMAQLMLLPLTVSCFSEIQITFTFLIPAHPGSPGQRAVKRVCVAYIQVTAEVHKFFKLQQLASLRPHHCPANRRTFQDLALRFPGLSTSWKFYKHNSRTRHCGKSGLRTFPRLHIAAAIVINTTVRSVIQTWVLSHRSQTRYHSATAI